MNKNYKIIGGVILAVIAGIFLLFKYTCGSSEKIKVDQDEIFVDNTNDSNLNQKISSNDSDNNESDKNKIVVEIKGEVNKPDIYYLTEDDIIDDLIKKAGGLTENADVSLINRAEKLKNHQSIVIPNKNEPEKSMPALNSSKGSESEGSLININTATESELDSLPGIGPAKAKSIIEYRESQGSFKNIEDIKNVKGIGNAFFEKIKDKITV